jgi:hypothetical protein
MHFRALVAFLVEASLFAIVPCFDSDMPGQGGKGELSQIPLLASVVGSVSIYEVP